MSAKTLKVTRIAETVLSSDNDQYRMEQWLEIDEATTPADALAEFAGRACYQSWSKPNPATATNDTYLGNIQKIGHFSVMSHASAVYYVEGVSRTLTHELVRHRFPSFSQLSQRYVRLDASLPYVIPPLARDNPAAEQLIAESAEKAFDIYHALIGELSRANPDASQKRIREAARCVLPGMTETKIVVGANMRTWRDLLAQRLPVSADAEIRELARLLLDDLRTLAPATFQDITDD